jgi:GH24 family phage-related lysozyme (muramidase)/peptidoglycan hydrolase-like protein with peptidoglycan-binding domain
MSEDKWADIDDAGYWHAPEAEEKPDGPAVTDDIISQEKKEEPLVKLSSGIFIEPSMGFEFNKQCKVRIKVDYLDESARNMKKVNFSLFSKYLGKTANLNVSKDGYEQDGYAEADVTLYYPSTYDEEKDLNVKYFFRATHRRGEKAVDSMELNMPQPLHFVELKKDDYDENGADKYNKEKDGDNYKEKQVVTELQKNLVTLGFHENSKDAVDGYFGDKTDKAVREFQDYAIKTDRMKRNKGKIEQADRALDQSEPDGIVGKKTADEIDLWLRKGWTKPEITLRHGEYDDTGVWNGKGKTGTDDHHKGKPVVEAQENLQNAGVYKEYNVDGWFHDHMYEAVKQFQEAAAEGKFLIDNVLTDIGEKLTGHVKGSYCPKTRAYLQTVVEKKGVVTKIIKMQTSENGKQFIMQHEGFRGMPYNDSAGYATIGYGTLLHKSAVNDEDRKKYKNGITKDEAKKLLETALVDFEKALNNSVKVALNQNQFDALMDWTYNLGPARLNEKNCTWLRELNAGNFKDVPQNLLSWNKAKQDGIIVELPGLTTRRKDEGDLFKKKM